jgi:hypothetical protein
MSAVVLAACAGGGDLPLTGEARVIEAPAHGGAWCTLRMGAVACVGELAPGDGATARPVPEAGVVVALHLEQTGSTACAVRMDRSVACWGNNAWGAAGQGWAPEPFEPDPDRRRVPRAHPVHALPPVDALTAGQLFFCALATDRSVWCWGRNEMNQITQVSHHAAVPTPVRIEGVPPAIEVIATLDQACVRSSAGAVWCWGDAPEGVTRAPREVVDAGVERLVVAGDLSEHICAETAAGRRCWEAAPTVLALDRQDRASDSR